MSEFKHGNTLSKIETIWYPHIRCFDQPDLNHFFVCFAGGRTTYIWLVNRITYKILFQYIVDFPISLSSWKCLTLQHSRLLLSTGVRTYSSKLTKTLHFKPTSEPLIPKRRHDSMESLYHSQGKTWFRQLSIEGTKLTCDTQEIKLPLCSLVSQGVPIHAPDYSSVILKWAAPDENHLQLQYWSQSSSFTVLVPDLDLTCDIHPNSLCATLPWIVLCKNNGTYQQRSKRDGSLIQQGSPPNNSCLLPNGLFCRMLAVNNNTQVTIQFSDVLWHTTYVMMCWAMMHLYPLFDMNVLRLIKAFL